MADQNFISQYSAVQIENVLTYLNNYNKKRIKHVRHVGSWAPSQSTSTYSYTITGIGAGSVIDVKFYDADGNCYSPAYTIQGSGNNTHAIVYSNSDIAGDLVCIALTDQPVAQVMLSAPLSMSLNHDDQNARNSDEQNDFEEDNDAHNNVEEDGGIEE